MRSGEAAASAIATGSNRARASIRHQTFGLVDVDRLSDNLIGRWLLIVQRVRNPEFLPFVLAHLMERQDVDAFDVAETSDECSRLLDVRRVVGQLRYEHVTKPDFSLARRQATGEFECRGIIHSGQATMPL